ncbi:MAG: 6-bladed beta-propeller [Balneola sp.]
MKKFILFCLIVVAWGCSSEEENRIPEQFKDLENLTVFSSDETPTQTFSFKKEGIFGNSEEVLIGRMGEIAVDSLGRVFISDIQKNEINIFEPGGNFLNSLGRQGVGPGEFNNIRSLQIVGNHLYVYDPSQYRVNIFSLTTFSNKGTITVGRNRNKFPELVKVFPWIHELYVTNNDTYLLQFISERKRFNKEWEITDTEGAMYLANRAGDLVGSKLLSFTEDKRINYKGLNITLPFFFGSTISTLGIDSAIYIATPDHFLIKVYNLKGEYQSAFYYPNNKIPLTEESAIKAELPPLYLKNLESIDAPKNWPTVTDLKIDDQDRLWVAVTVENMNVYEWWVLESSGEVITKFEWSRDKPIQQIRNEYLYTKEKDQEGADIVVKYKIEFKEREY